MGSLPEINVEHDIDGHRKQADRLTGDKRGREEFLEQYGGFRSYHYQELPPGYIRLLKLLQGDGYDQIISEIEACSIADAPEFHALSHSWGAEAPAAFIRVDRRAMKVTYNLKIALAYLRRKDNVHRLWVDAICINQHDDAEKAIQVQMMRQIYERSAQTIVWVGESPPPYYDDGDSPNLTAFDLCERVTESLAAAKKSYQDPTQRPRLRSLRQRLSGSSLNIVSKEEPVEYPVSEQLEIYEEALRLAYEPGERTAPQSPIESLPTSMEALTVQDSQQGLAGDPGTLWHAVDNEMLEMEIASFDHILDGPWFTRIWVLQEVAVAQKVVVQCGPATIDWRTLTIAAFVLHRAVTVPRFGALLANIDLSKVLQISVLRNMVQRQKDLKLPPEMESELRLISLVKRYRSWNAKDSRDKIYALLGLAPPADVDFTADYTRSVAETYRAFATAMLRKTYRLDLWTGLKGQSDITPQLPDWVPDWKDTTPQLDLLFNAEVMSYTGKKSCTGRAFCASGPKQMTPIFTTSGGKFIADGLQIGSIQHLGATIESSKEVLKSSWMDYTPHDANEIVRSTAALFKLTATLMQWGILANLAGTRAIYRTGETTENAYRAILNLGLLPRGFTEEDALKHFRTWRSLLKLVHNTFEGFDVLKVDMGDLLSGKDARVPLVADMWKNLTDRVAQEDGGYSAAVRKAFALAHHEDYLGKLYSATGAASRVARGIYHSRRRKDLNLALVINNPLACNLEYINQRRLALTDTDFLVLVPHEAQMDDRLVILDGGAVPFVVRRRGDRWKLVGSAYVHGAMYGEEWKAEKVESMEFI